MLRAVDTDLHRRAEQYAALGDPIRLAIVDELVRSDRSPSELRLRLGIESNLLAHHLDVLDDAGLIARNRSSGDGRRRYVHLRPRGRRRAADRRPPARPPRRCSSAPATPLARSWPPPCGGPSPDDRPPRPGPTRPTRSTPVRSTPRPGPASTSATPSPAPSPRAETARAGDHRVRPGPRAGRRWTPGSTGRSPTRCPMAPRRRSTPPSTSCGPGSAPSPTDPQAA